MTTRRRPTRKDQQIAQLGMDLAAAQQKLRDSLAAARQARAARDEAIVELEKLIGNA